MSTATASDEAGAIEQTALPSPNADNETTDPIGKVKQWVETHRAESMLLAFGLGVFLGVFTRR